MFISFCISLILLLRIYRFHIQVAAGIIRDFPCSFNCVLVSLDMVYVKNYFCFPRCYALLFPVPYCPQYVLSFYSCTKISDFSSYFRFGQLCPFFYRLNFLRRKKYTGIVSYGHIILEHL